MWQMRKIRLWEKEGWIIIRSRETARKLGLYMEKERDMRYEKFQTTGQERVRLACALEGLFLTNECEEEKKTAYGQYLKRRIRPAMEALIREDTILKNFPLFCPKCKSECLIDIEQFHITVIKAPDAQPQSR